MDQPKHLLVGTMEIVLCVALCGVAWAQSPPTAGLLRAGLPGEDAELAAALRIEVHACGGIEGPPLAGEIRVVIAKPETYVVQTGDTLAGIYFLDLRTPSWSETRKLVIAR